MDPLARGPAPLRADRLDCRPIGLGHVSGLVLPALWRQGFVERTRRDPADLKARTGFAFFVRIPGATRDLVPCVGKCTNHGFGKSLQRCLLPPGRNAPIDGRRKVAQDPGQQGHCLVRCRRQGLDQP